jgi:hypothetical protein
MPDRGLTSWDIARAAELTGQALTEERLTTWAIKQRELASRVEHNSKILGEVAGQALAELAGEENCSIAPTWKRLEEAEQALRQSSAEQPFVEAQACSFLQAIQARSDEGRLENSSRAAAIHALRQEAELASVIVRAASEVENLLAAFATNTKPPTPT